jgi:Tol biopolymer transport system component
LATTLLGVDNIGVGLDTNGQSDVFVRDKNSSTIERVSLDNLGAQANDASTDAVISADGRYVSFTTREPFDATDFPSTYDIYRAYNAALP